MKPEDVKGLPLPWEVPLDSSPALLAFGNEAGNPQSSTYYVAKARKARVTSSKREDLKSAQNAECANHAIVTTEDFAVSEEDYQKMQEGGLVILKDEVVKRSVIKNPNTQSPRSKPEPKDAWKLECAPVSDRELADTLAGLIHKQIEASLFTRWFVISKFRYPTIPPTFFGKKFSIKGVRVKIRLVVFYGFPFCR